MKKCYSANGEEFNFDSLDEAVRSLLDNEFAEPGDPITIWEADAIHRQASWFVPQIAEAMIDRACEEAGEYADRWDFSMAQEESLQEIVEAAVDKWAAENNMHPSFWTVENSVAIKVRITGPDGEYEILPGQ